MAQQQQNRPQSSVKSSVLADQYGWSEAQIDVLRRVLCATATDDELHFFLSICKRTKLDPFTNQIWFVKRRQKQLNAFGGDEWVEVGRGQTGIDGYRVIAERSGSYRGQRPIEWCGSDGEWTQVWLKSTPPAAARATVLRDGFEPMVCVALWSEYVPTFSNNRIAPKWSQSPAFQLGKCAEALALRKAFPNDLSGLYTDTEMEHAYVDATSTESKAGPVDARPAKPAKPDTVPVAELAAGDDDAALDEFKRLCSDAKSRADLRKAQRVLKPIFERAEKGDDRAKRYVDAGNVIYQAAISDLDKRSEK